MNSYANMNSSYGDSAALDVMTQTMMDAVANAFITLKPDRFITCAEISYNVNSQLSQDPKRLRFNLQFTKGETRGYFDADGTWKTEPLDRLILTVRAESDRGPVVYAYSYMYNSDLSRSDVSSLYREDRLMLSDLTLLSKVDLVNYLSAAEDIVFDIVADRCHKAASRADEER